MKRLFLVLFVLCIWAATPAMALIPMSGLSSQGTKDVPDSFQIAADYSSRTDGQPVYLGYAPKTAATSESVWIIYKFTYDGSDQMTVRKSAYGVWDDRASLTYE